MCRYGRVVCVESRDCARASRRCHKAYGWSIDRPALGPRSRRGTAGCLVGSACIRERMIDREAHRAETHCKFDGCRELLLAACSTAEVEPGPITSFDDIAGTIYERQGPGNKINILFFEDGTWHTINSSNRALVVDRPTGVIETRFEGTTVFLHEVEGAFCGDDPDAIYEIDVLENGNLQFVAIEDPCGLRSGIFSAEWEPVP